MKLCPKCGKHFSDDANFCPVDAARLTPLEAATAPAGGGETDALAARFDLGERLGGATTGEVRKATDKTAARTVAVKIIANSVMGLPQIAQRIERELKQLERVDSAAVAKVVASGKRGDQAWVATEFVPDVQTLAQVLAARGPLPAPTAAQLVATIGEALIEAAKVGVVHRDLAPKNVLLVGGSADPGAQVKLINFCAPTPSSEKAPGVPEYVAPEVIEGRQLDQRSNIYSLGAIYYHALTGSPPFAGDLHAVHAAHLAGNPEAPSKRAGGAGETDALVLRALERNPAKRYLTVRQFVDEVQRVARGGSDASGTQRLGGAGAGASGKQKPKEVIQTLMGVPPAVGTATSGGTPKAEPVIELTPKAPAPAPAPAPVPAPVAAAVAAPAPVAVPPSAIPTIATPAVAVAPAPASAVSPWAPSAAQIDAATAQAATAPAPSIPAAPVMPASPSVPAGAKTGDAAGGKKKPDDNKGAKGKFRETMWFKKGELDAAAAEAAAEEAARTGKANAPDKADSLPMEDRYKDDGSLSRGDRDKYSLKTGDTTMMPAVKVPGGGGTSRSRRGSVSEDELVGEMKGGRNTTLIVIVLVLAALGGLVAFLSLR